MLRIALAGDAMLGRLLDQTLPYPLKDASEMVHGAAIRRRLGLPHPPYTAEQEQALFKRPWGDTLFLLGAADLRVVNLETSITTSNDKYPGKAFNFRLHPRNAAVVTAAGIDYVSLANNHIFDFGVSGITETLATLDAAGIAHAGAGSNLAEAWKPAVLERNGLRILLYSFSDHGTGMHSGQDDPWAAGQTTPGMNYIPLDAQHRLTQAEMTALGKRIAAEKAAVGAHICIASIHWGPNYAWQPASALRELAHALTDVHTGGVDVVSSVPLAVCIYCYAAQV
jgi:poly-gamma-glutamate capsule biosynthesis protein CapA/YwtB (metallophosphatase superfamily)